MSPTSRPTQSVPQKDKKTPKRVPMIPVSTNHPQSDSIRHRLKNVTSKSESEKPSKMHASKASLKRTNETSANSNVQTNLRKSVFTAHMESSPAKNFLRSKGTPMSKETDSINGVHGIKIAPPKRLRSASRTAVRSETKRTFSQ
ncbi:hypothetical protein Ddc_08606 [Ditylenchus destructor]|nr:hypothetical protein Ddc_08606 [Ditylenchus destructor]